MRAQYKLLALCSYSPPALQLLSVDSLTWLRRAMEKKVEDSFSFILVAVLRLVEDC